MPHGSTKFQSSWLSDIDSNGQTVRDWCRRGNSDIPKEEEDDNYLRGATSINHQVALHANFKMYSRSTKGVEKGDPNRNPWLAKMGFVTQSSKLIMLENHKFFNMLKEKFTKILFHLH